MSDIVGGIASVTLGDEEARRRGGQKSILERKGPPTFTIAVEMVQRGRWRVHRSVADSVDALLLGKAMKAQSQGVWVGKEREVLLRARPRNLAAPTKR